MDAATTVGELPVGQGRRFQAHALAAMYGAGGTLGLLAVLVPHGEGVNAAAWTINSALGLPVGLFLLWLGGRTPTWLIHTLLVIGAGMVSLGMVFGDAGPASVATSFFFVWIALYVGWFFAPRAAVAHLVTDAVAFAAVMTFEASDSAPAVWLLVMGTATVVCVVVSFMRKQLVAATTLDPLTGLPTRLAFNEAFSRETARSRRRNESLCVAIIDVDGLKAVNDRDGHKAGDALLVQAAAGWQAALRKSDLLVRFGGDEFVALLPDCDRDGATCVLDRLHEATPVPWSAGIATWRPGETADEVLARADSRLYEAKRSNSAA